METTTDQALPTLEGFEAPAPKRTRAPRQKAPNKEAPLINKRQLTSELQGLVRMVNIGVRLVTPYPEVDPLNDEEIDALVKGVVAEIELYPRILVWVKRVGSYGPHLALARVLVFIALPRLSVRGMIPPGIAMMLGMPLPPPTPDPEQAINGVASYAGTASYGPAANTANPRVLGE